MSRAAPGTAFLGSTLDAPHTPTPRGSRISTREGLAGGGRDPTGSKDLDTSHEAARAKQAGSFFIKIETEEGDTAGTQRCSSAPQTPPDTADAPSPSPY